MAESNAINANTTGIVGNTGTGFTGTPLTQYLVNCGGATSSTISQVASTGTSGQVLTSNGASALPTFQDVSASGAFTQVVIQTFTTTGANTYTPTSGMKYCIVEVQAGGGGGGGANSTGIQQVAGGGGGAGAYARGVFSAATVGASQTVTVGAGGTAGAGSGGTGGTGGTSSFGSLISCTGGLGGVGATPDSALGSKLGGVGGTASGSGVSFSIGSTVNKGTIALWINTGIQLFAYPGSGANSPLGLGATAGAFVGGGTATGGNGYQGGGGSGGVRSGNIGSSAGGAGGDGIVIITEYI